MVDYINQLFPNEQSLGNIDDVISSMTERVRDIDQDIRNVVRGHTHAGQVKTLSALPLLAKRVAWKMDLLVLCLPRM